MRYAFTVPGKPQPWQRAGHNQKTGAHYTPKETVRYQKKVRTCARLAGVQVLAKPVKLVLRIYFPDNRTRDDDNVEKTIRDALQRKAPRKPRKGSKGKTSRGRPAIAFWDDSHVKGVKKSVEVDRDNPRVEVELEGELAMTLVDDESAARIRSLSADLRRRLEKQERSPKMPLFGRISAGYVSFREKPKVGR